MKPVRFAFAMMALAGLTACGGMDVATRNAPLEGVGLGSATKSAPIAASVAITDYKVSVPRSLSSSEANMYYPIGDIVWREDPLGDRHKQVAMIFDGAVQKAQAGMANGALPVKVEITVKQFHALTQKTRYTVGGVHSIKFDLRVTDPVTGSEIVPVREITANLKGYGGTKALHAESRGHTQKVRITQHIANVVEQELKFPGSTGEEVTKLVGGLETPKVVLAPKG